MKKLTALILTLALAALSVCAIAATPTDLSTATNLTKPSGNKNNAATATVVPEAAVEQLTGVVLEQTEEGFLLSSETLGAVQIVTDADTVLDTDAEVQAGDYVIVEFSGALTRSTIPQAYARRVVCHTMVGTITEVAEDGFMMTDDQNQQVYVLADSAVLADLHAEQAVTVYHNGAVMLSLPAQVNALLVRLSRLVGTVEQEQDGVYLIKDAQGVEWEAQINANSRVWAEPQAGDTVCVAWNGVATKSIPAQLQVMEIYPVAAETTETIVD